MNKRIRVYPYKQGSKGAKALSVALGGKVLKLENSKYVQREGDLIINWGATESPYRGPTVANQPEAIANASNKLTCLETLSEAGVRVPAFTDDMDEAAAWLMDKDYSAVMCRTLLTGSEGRGIVVASNEAELVEAPLYTAYVKKKDEYRVHVLRKPGEEEPSIISSQRKAKRHDADVADFKIRNHKNGFVFVREDVDAPEDVKLQAIEAVRAAGLAFGAVDVIWNEHLGLAYVLEINTAPGLEGRTVEDYAAAFKEII